MNQTTTQTTTAVWTLVYRAPRGRFFRPVSGLSPMTWEEATRVGSLLTAVFPDVEIWTTPSKDAPVTVEEDRDNILLEDSRGRTRRVPIRWDAPSELDARTLAPADLSGETVEEPAPATCDWCYWRLGRQGVPAVWRSTGVEIDTWCDAHKGNATEPVERI